MFMFMYLVLHFYASDFEIKMKEPVITLRSLTYCPRLENNLSWIFGQKNRLVTYSSAKINVINAKLLLVFCEMLEYGKRSWSFWMLPATFLKRNSGKGVFLGTLRNI